MRRSFLVMLSILLIAPAAVAETEDLRVLVIVLDGLRPDYVTPELMPNVHRLGSEGVISENHHAVFPTVTRVNSPSFSTGSYPSTHGLLGNSVYFPEVDERPLSTSSAGNLQRIQEAEGGRILNTETLAEYLDEQGEKLLVCSSGSGGSAFLLNPQVKGGGIINTSIVVPDKLAAVAEERLGPVPGESEPNRARNEWAVNAYLKIGLEEIQPRVTLMWLSDPDHTGHAKGMGAPETNAGIRFNDALIGRIVAEHEKRGLNVAIMVSSDHGFSTHTGGVDLYKPLIDAGVIADRTATDIVFAGPAVYVREGGPERVRQIVEAYQRTPGFGAIFTEAESPGSSAGSVLGTLSFDLIRWNHSRSAQILLDADWTNEENEHGYKGTTTMPGVAGHGSSSPWDIHNTLVAFGPGFKEGVRNKAPTGNVDVAPTVCRLLGLEPPESMDGRVLEEILAEGPDPDTLVVKSSEVKVENHVTSYKVTAHFSEVNGHRYLDYTKATRSADE
jgi:predicted AlkP superfamily pyrophosphatase or phosphodiesterase